MIPYVILSLCFAVLSFNICSMRMKDMLWQMEIRHRLYERDQ